MIDIDKLRQALGAVQPEEVEELLDRLEAAEKERDAAELMSLALRAKVEAMEKQEPVAWARKLGMDLPSFGCVTDLKYRPSDMPESAYMPLYALPSAQRTQSVPDISDDIIEAIESRAEQSYRRHHSGIRGQQITPADDLSWHIIHATRSVLVEAMEASRAT